jgi:hypothetical protein
MTGSGSRTGASRLTCGVLLLAACGLPKGSLSPGELDSIDLAPSPGWPGEVVSRSVPSSFSTTITALEVDPSGKVWLLRDELSKPGQLQGTPVLERYATTGHLERRLAFPALAKVSGFVVHPSGNLSLLGMRAAGAQQYELELLRLSPDGESLASTSVEEIPGPRENLFYDGAGGVHELPVDGPFKLGFGSHLAGLADGEGLYLLAEWTYGFKLYRLDAAGRRTWGAQVMPANIGMAFPYSPSLLASDGDGIYVTTQIFEDDVHIYGEHFGRSPLVPLGSYDSLVQKFDTRGTFVGARLFGGSAVEYPTAMTVHAGVVLVGGSSRITKHDAPNRTMEWDIALMRGRVDDSSALDYRTIDLARDDFGWTLAEAPDGHLILGGRTDYVQVDTNSEVENGKGLLLGLRTDLTPGAVLDLPMPRDVQVRAVRFLPDGKVVLAGTRDGPLTHTEPSMTGNDGFWGIARFGD